MLRLCASRRWSIGTGDVMTFAARHGTTTAVALVAKLERAPPHEWNRVRALHA
jgi:hypothetical protein